MNHTRKPLPKAPVNLPSGPSIQTSGDNKTATYLPISEQIRRAFQKTHRMPMIAGCLLGAFVPVAVYLTSHSDAIQSAGGIHKAIVTEPFLTLLILGGLLFSATSVVRWGYQAFGQSWSKAIGFVILVEGTLILSPVQWLSLGALVYLVAINAMATGTTLALDRKKHFQLKRQTAKSKATGTHQLALPAPTQKQQGIHLQEEVEHTERRTVIRRSGNQELPLFDKSESPKAAIESARETLLLPASPAKPKRTRKPKTKAYNITPKGPAEIEIFPAPVPTPASSES